MPGSAIVDPDDAWAPVKRMVEAAEAAWEEEQEKVNRLLEKSKEVLRPLQDPFGTDFHNQGDFWISHENDYSNWLAWMVESAGSLDPKGVLWIFLDEPPAGLPAGMDRKVPIKAQPRKQVGEGHPGQKGYPDLFISMDDRPVLVVEVKVTTAEEADTKKNEGYARSLKKDGFEGPLVLLAIDGECEDYHGFRLRRWWEACVGLRRLARAVKDKDILVAAMVLAFAGNVEQRLLRLRADRVRDVLVAQILEGYLEQGGST